MDASDDCGLYVCVVILYILKDHNECVRPNKWISGL